MTEIIDNVSDDGFDFDPEIEVLGNWKIIDLPEITLVSPEANYDILHKFKGRLFRLKDNQWCQRGEGEIKFIQHKQTNQVVLLMRQSKTYFIRANHFVHRSDPFCTLQKSTDYEFSWEWQANDISNGPSLLQTFSLNLLNEEESQKFKDAFEEACQINEPLF